MMIFKFTGNLFLCQLLYVFYQLNPSWLCDGNEVVIKKFLCSQTKSLTEDNVPATW